MSDRRPHLAWAGGLAAAGLAWYSADSLRHRREEGSSGYELAGERVGHRSHLHARRRGADRGADHRGQPHRAAGQRRRHLPALPGDHRRRGAQPEHHHLRVLEGPDRHRRGRGADRAREGRGRGQRADRRPGRGEDGPLAAGRHGGRRRDRAPLPPAQALRGAAAGEPHPPQAADRRRPRGHDRRRRHRRGVDRQRPGPRPLARHPRPRRGAGRARAAGRVRRELDRGHRPGAGRRGLPARHRAVRGRRADAGHALQRRRGRHQRRGADLPGHRRGRPHAGPDLGLLRAPARVPAGAGGRGRARRPAADPGARLAHRQGHRPDRRAGRSTTSCWRSAPSCTSTAPRCCTPRR